MVVYVTFFMDCSIFYFCRIEECVIMNIIGAMKIMFHLSNRLLLGGYQEWILLSHTLFTHLPFFPLLILIQFDIVDFKYVSM